MAVVAIHIDSTDMQFHSFTSNKIAAGIPEIQVSRMVKKLMPVFWPQFSMDFDALGIKTFAFMRSFKNNNNKKLEIVKKG